MEVEFPVFMSLIGEMLRFTGDGIDLAPCCADFLDHALVYIAP